jgi:hypothetical protein
VVAYQALLLAGLAAGKGALAYSFWRWAAREQAEQPRRVALDDAILWTGLTLACVALVPVAMTRALWAAILALGLLCGAIAVVYGGRLLSSSRSAAARRKDR